MKLREIISEAEMLQDISDDLMDFILAYHQDGKETVPMQGANGVIEYLKKMHYSVDPGSIMDLLSKEPFTDVIKRSDPEKITLKSADLVSRASPDEMEKSQEKVDKMATKVAKQSIKQGDQL